MARSRVPEDGRAAPGVSCQFQFGGLRRGIEPENFFACGVQEKLNGRLEVAQTFLPGLALSVCAWNFQTSRPKTTLVRLAAMNYGREFFILVS